MERRRFLLNLSLAGAGAAALGSLPPGARRALAAIRSAPPGVIVRNDWPEHWETSIEALGQSFHTPNRVFFVRSHLPVPEIDAKSWRLEVAGLARAPRSLSLAELKGFPAHEGTAAPVTACRARRGRNGNTARSAMPGGAARVSRTS